MKGTKRVLTLLTLMMVSIGAIAQELNQNLVKGFEAVTTGNYTEAIKYFKAGALEGDRFCCGRLAGMYLNGLGVAINIPEARKWAMKGYHLGNSYSAAIAGQTYIIEYGMDSSAGLEKAMPYLEYAYYADDREFDNADLYANTALIIATTKMNNGNIEEGLRWLNRAITDFPTFMPVIGQAAYIYWSLEDYPKAVRYATIVDKENNPQGSFVLGWCLAHGKGILKNEEAGYKKVRKAAMMGTPEYAMYALGELYYKGIGTSVNKASAKEWYKKAAEAGIEEAKNALDTLF